MLIGTARLAPFGLRNAQLEHTHWTLHSAHLAQLVNTVGHALLANTASLMTSQQPVTKVSHRSWTLTVSPTLMTHAPKTKALSVVAEPTLLSQLTAAMT